MPTNITSETMRSDKPAVERVSIRPFLCLCALVTIVFLSVWAVYSNILFQATTNRLNQYRYCLNIREMNVLPRRNESTYNPTGPHAFGEWLLDFPQLEVRWSFVDALDDSIQVGSIGLRGPLSFKHPEVAPVILAMGTEKNKRKEKYVGRETIDGKLALRIIEHPESYYVSFEDSNGRELIRDSLGSMCRSHE